ncbi:MAG: signal peptidase II [Chloroflexota bacterium]|nr:signal peptidase II [Chloroflexota bacterium]
MSEGRAERAPGRSGRWLLFATLAGGVLVIDQASKGWVESAFRVASTRGSSPGLAPPTPILGDFVRIAKTYNDGGIFGLFGSSAPVLALASLLVIGLIVLYQARTVATAPVLLTATLGLLLGGAVGNLVDRLRFGHVIDFVDMGVGGFRWYTFNVADASISIAVVGLVALSLMGDRRGGGERSRRIAATSGATDRAG